MNFLPDNVYHVFNQGNNHEILFRQHEDYLGFIREIRKLLLPNCEIVAYCLMPNHFHLIIYTDERAEQLIKQGGLLLDPITNALRKLLSGFARIINKKYNRSGSLFRQKTKTKLLSEDNVLLDVTKNVDYCANCFVYVHQNPLNAGIVSKLENWEYSSFKDFAGLRNGTLCNKEIAAKFCSYKSEDFMKSCYEEVIVDFENHF